MSANQLSTSVSIIDALNGFMNLSLTEYSTSAAAAIAAGSVVNVAGGFFRFPADETPTGWSAITTGTTAYIALTASGTAGSQVVNAGYVSTAPAWRDDLGAWYASAASEVRIVASVYKAEATSYWPKFVFPQGQTRNPRDVDASAISCGSSLTVAGPATCASSLSVSGRFSPNGVEVTGRIQQTSITGASFYSAISTAVPSVGDTCLATGRYSVQKITSSVKTIINSFERMSASSISLYGVEQDSHTLATDSVTAYNFSEVSIAW